LSEGEFLLYPNPARDILTVQRSSSEIEVLTVFDGAGRVVMQQSLNSAVEQVNLNELAPGMYVARTGNFTHPLLIIR
ncbi:MAG: T9SS type A sorting domain-containing protein, partial [Flavobacteriales bacterium]